MSGAAPETCVAECFWPDVDEEAVWDAASRIRAQTAQPGDGATEVELTGTIFLPGDEVVFYLFNGSPDAVREVCERARVPFERVVESVRT